jgi:hypothetical protein
MFVSLGSRVCKTTVFAFALQPSEQPRTSAITILAGSNISPMASVEPNCRGPRGAQILESS